jgi:L-alanine-DL-glutamate epimerase-like enolase superfamily enzyme
MKLRYEPITLDLKVPFRIAHGTSEEDWEGTRRVRQASPIPIFADEQVRRARDVARLAGVVDGVNIEVMKAGGLREVMRMIAFARAHDIQVMLGCMLETLVGITAAAHRAPLVDWADLDGNLLIAKDPFAGMVMEQGCIRLPDGPGLGVTARRPERAQA